MHWHTSVRYMCQLPAHFIAIVITAGDPIEVGAALAVLRGSRAPLALSAAKSRLGHAEPAAGAIGMLQVCCASA